MSPLGPIFRNTQTLGALATVRPLQDNAWIYRVLPFMAIVWFALEADAVGVVYTFSAGSDIQAGPDAPVTAGATAGVFQNDNNFFDQYPGSRIPPNLATQSPRLAPFLDRPPCRTRHQNCDEIGQEVRLGRAERKEAVRPEGPVVGEKRGFAAPESF